MSRALGVGDATQAVLPDWTAPAVALLTQLGDGWFVALLLAVLYWRRADSRDRLLLVGAMVLAVVGSYQFLKYSFTLPRPDQPLLDPAAVPALVRPLYEATGFATGYGFPSGHAATSTVLYIGLAAVLPVGSRRQRYLTAAGLVALVGFTRVALGLHVLVDVVAGVAVGGAVLTVGLLVAPRFAPDSVTGVSTLAVVTTALFLLASDAAIEAILGVGAALGLLAGRQIQLLVGTLDTLEDPSAAGAPVALRGLLALAALAVLVAALPVLATSADRPYALGTVAGLAVTGLLAGVAARSSPRWRFLATPALWSSAVRDALGTATRE